MNLRVAVRSLWKSPVFTIVSVTVLALGIGANTAIFSVVNALLLRPLPYKNPDRIVSIQKLWLQKGVPAGALSWPDFVDYRNQNQSFEAMSAYEFGIDSVYANDQAQRTLGATTDTQFFNIFGVKPELGRIYTDSDKQNPTFVAVISDRLFQRIFHKDPRALGKPMRMAQHEFTLIGVMPAGFRYPEETDVWVPDYPFLWGGSTSRSAHNFRALGLLRPGISVVQAQAEMKTIAARLAQQYPQDDSKKSVVVLPLHDELVRKVRTTLYLLLGAVGLVLLIACANIANLLLAKLTLRRQEMAVRAALGASHADIVRQLLAEALALTVPSAVLGLALGYWTATILVRMAPEGLPPSTKVIFDWRIALFTVLVALFCAIVFSLAPALQTSSVDLKPALHGGGSYALTGGGLGKLRSSITIAEIAMSMALLIGAAILVRSLLALDAVDPGYRIDKIWVMNSTVPSGGSPEDDNHAVRFYSSLIEQAAATPGVEAVAATNAPPNDHASDGTFFIEGRPDPPPGDFLSQQSGFMSVSGNYFHTLAIPLKSGRDFDERDAAPNSQLTCIVNQSLARTYFPGENAIGHRIRLGYDMVSWKNYMTIVGVAGDARQDSIEVPPGPYVYMPYQQHAGRAAEMKLIFRGSQEATAAIGAAARHLDPAVPIEFRPLSSYLDQAFAPSRFRSGLLGSFAGLALLLAVAGLYGVMSYSVAQRRSEIGVRMALGAQRAEVVTMILREGFRLVLPGIFLGAALAYGSGKLFTSLVYGVKPSDPITFIEIAAVLVTVALAAMYIPARRAAAVDPMLALRSE